MLPAHQCDCPRHLETRMKRSPLSSLSMAVALSCLLQSHNQVGCPELPFYQEPTLKVVQGGQNAEPIGWDPQLPPQQKALRENELCAEAFSFVVGIWFLWLSLLSPPGSCHLFSSGSVQRRQHQIKRGPRFRCRFCGLWSKLWPWAFICEMGITWGGSFPLGSVGGFHELGQRENAL